MAENTTNDDNGGDEGESGVKKLKGLLIPTNLLKIDHKKNTRGYDPKLAEQYANSFEDVGQLQPIAVIEEDGKYDVGFGFHRAEGARIYNKRHPGKPMLVKALVMKKADDVDRFIKSAVENAQRRNVNPIAMAEQQKYMMNTLGKSPEEVARYYGQHVDTVKQLERVLKLPAKLKAMVATKELPVIAAIELLALEPKEQDEVIGKAKRKKSGRIKGESVRKAVKEKKREKAAKAGKSTVVGKNNKVMTRSAKEVVALFEDYTAANEQENLRVLATAIIKYKDGKASEKKTREIIESLGGAVKPAPKKEKGKDKEEEPASAVSLEA